MKILTPCIQVSMNKTNPKPPQPILKLGASLTEHVFGTGHRLYHQRTLFVSILLYKPH